MCSHINQKFPRVYDYNTLEIKGRSEYQWVYDYNTLEINGRSECQCKDEIFIRVISSRIRLGKLIMEYMFYLLE